MTESGLHALRVVTFESRRSTEMAELIRNYGGEPIPAPAMREVPLADQREALEFGEALVAGDVEILLLLTGVGTRLLVGALSTRWPREKIVESLRSVSLVCRGPKPVAALKELGLAPTVTVPEPNTWRDILSAMDRAMPVAGKRLAVQEYGARNEELIAGLRQRGAQVKAFPVYAWALPQDTAPVRSAIETLVNRSADVVLFTSATQIDHVFRIAEDMGKGAAFRDALNRSAVIASIGPVTTEALREHGLVPDLVPEHPKMGHLVAEVARGAPGVLARKRGDDDGRDS